MLSRFWKTVMGMRTGVVVMRMVMVTRSGVVRSEVVRVGVVVTTTMVVKRTGYGPGWRLSIG